MDLLNGKKMSPNGKLNMEKESTFWKMWSEHLPGSFPKAQFRSDFELRWNISWSNIIARLKEERFMNLKSDLMFMFENYGIAFDYKDKGFFLDQKQYDLIQDRDIMENAKMFGLTKEIY